MDYLAFYWTLPVNWAGFTALPAEADAAARVSRTIRYQVDRVRRWVKDEKGRILKETVFLETRPDRGTEAIRDDMAKILAQAESLGAAVVLVDFSQAFGWRPHGPLFDMIAKARHCVLLPPDPVMIDGAPWDPVDHFRAWRALDLAWHDSKDTQKAAARAAMAALRAEGASHAAIAAALNARGLKTVTGRVWTAENVRKMLAQG